MGTRRNLLVAVLVGCCAVAVVGFYEEREEEGGMRERGEGEDMFLLHEMRHVVKTDAGDMKVVKGFGGKVGDKPIEVGFITMEPKTLFIPQYLDSDLIIFIRRGEATVASISKEELVEKNMKMGDIYRIGAGNAFYLVNTGEGQRLHIICSIDKSYAIGWGSFQSFFIGGGTNPTSVLAGFDHDTLATAFNVSTSELKDVLTRQRAGPIVFLPDSHEEPSVWTQFLQLKHRQRLHHVRRMVRFYEEVAKEEEEPKGSWRKLLISVFGNEPNLEDNKRKTPDSYNLYDRKPDFKNNYGWSMAIDESEYWPLGHSGIGIYLVNLTAGSMMAPHINPMATEYGIVLRGSGTIQIVFPNGTLAMKAKVSEGDVFWIPRYFPFCQIASRAGPFEFFGFTTSARKNRPQFLVGAHSVLHNMLGPEFAAAFGVSEERLTRIVGAQKEDTILPSPSVAPPDEWMREEVMRSEKIHRVVGGFGEEMMMNFD
ncbi:Vicilin-like seed storage protein [Actinidia chinensis var. chinensis]|uniref:Vicilin-like seed storage protein n=1 Tax=Actinidia chinensis var. chinensis TaxID=1590841 RepID=A0A2R6P7J6_ACTCC|nr:Vicilin-like seed storage protein [Actinidia chinensis var. chinensis]